MTPTLSALPSVLAIAPAPAPAKPADGVGAPDTDGTAFARELSRAQDAGPPSMPSAPAAKGGKPVPPGRASTERAGTAPSGRDATVHPRSGEPGKAEATDGGVDADGDAEAQVMLPADLTSMINSLLGLPIAPAGPTAEPPAAAAAAAAAAADTAGIAGAAGSILAGADKGALGEAALPLPTAPGTGTGNDLRSGGALDAQGGAHQALGASNTTRSTTEMQAAPAEPRGNPSTDAPASLPAAQETSARPSTEPVPVPLAALPASVSTTGQAAPASTAAAPSAPFEARLHAALGSLDFAPAFGQQIRVLVQDGVQHARLHLNPAEMGPITVQIALDGVAAQVHLAVEHPLTRQALEQAMPVLASALREGGLTLSGGGVFEQPRDPQRDSTGSPSGGARRDDSGIDPGGRATLAEAAPRRLRGAVDLIA